MISTAWSTEQMIDRWEDRRTIQNLMSKYTYHFLLKKEKDIFNTFWSKTAHEPSLGLNNGYYLGQEAIEGYYDALHRKTLLTTRLLKEKFPEKLGEKSDEELYGVGVICFKPLDTSVIEIAGDGLTAKGMWYCRGSCADLTPGGPLSYWTFGCYAVDFVKEGEEWKIWHMLYLEDINHPCGASWANKPWEYPEAEEFAEMKAFAMPEPNVPRTLREYYHTERPFSKLPDAPEPYTHFGETFSYGYEKGGE